MRRFGDTVLWSEKSMSATLKASNLRVSISCRASRNSCRLLGVSMVNVDSFRGQLRVGNRTSDILPADYLYIWGMFGHQ